ncbi:Eukaryotic translation initiation factor 2D [Taenia crassiceps]|uniref:Eukaryotic translation initiation factor 2D n=1 Tax=Taenia crassiceps TaxID=6207 RepID=A0ABR4QDA8_9CEST
MLFLKPFKIRANVILRETKRRKLIQRVIEVLHVSTEDADSIFKDKVASELKIHTSTRHDIVSYLFDGVPMVFLYEGEMIPTVFILSQLSSSIAPLLFTYDDAMDRIFGGSDLMTGDVIRDEPFGRHIHSLRNSSVCSVAAVAKNAADGKCSKPLAVGVSTMGASELKAAGEKSRAILILHTLQDKLTELCPPHLLNSYKLTDKIEINHNIEPIVPSEAPIDEAAGGDGSPGLDGDDLLMSCFLHALRSLKQTDLPLPINVLYAKHMKSDCPNGEKMDIRKTSYKKMATEGILTLETVDVGITRLTAFRVDHPKLQELEQALPELAKSGSITGSGGSLVADSADPKLVVGDFYFGPPALKEVRIITPRIAPFFASAGYRTDDCIEQSNICRIVGAYVDSNKLRDAENRDLINVDDLLVRICDPNLLKESSKSTLAEPHFQITFQDLITSLTKGLKVAYRIIYPPESGLVPVITTDNKSPKLNLYEVRQNGKDVTRIAGLNGFGIDPKPFSRYIQAKLACSANLTEDPRYGTSMVVQAQGRHITALSKILTETFGLSKKWIEGYKETMKKSGRK